VSDDYNAADEQPAPESKEPVEAGLSADRRKALKKLGRFGLYTAPALLMLFESEKAVAQSGDHDGRPR